MNLNEKHWKESSEVERNPLETILFDMKYG